MTPLWSSWGRAGGLWHAHRVAVVVRVAYAAGGTHRGRTAAKSDANTQNTDGYTALMMACNWEHTEMVALLLGAGADPGLRSKSGRTCNQPAGYSQAVQQLLSEHTARTGDVAGLPGDTATAKSTGGDKATESSSHAQAPAPAPAMGAGQPAAADVTDGSPPPRKPSVGRRRARPLVEAPAVSTPVVTTVRSGLARPNRRSARGYRTATYCRRIGPQ
jgi:ankyrin repeat protein